ncbi:hypothetical protein EDD11_008363 [Mortierella claussenii]|nr:hypothetical protein EDD11_008363 [Mortierella claussenii]
MLAEDEEFLITSIGPDCIKVTSDLQDVAVVRASSTVTRKPQEAIRSSLPKHIVDTMRANFEQTPHATQFFEMHCYADRPMDFDLRRNVRGHCVVCEREHDRENAYLRLADSGTVFLNCYRGKHPTAFIMDETALEYDAIVQTRWKFLYKDWPIIDRVKHHRTEIAVNDIDSIKTFVLNRLGVIPVFFILTVIFGTRAYSCPYRNVENGVTLLYVLLKGVSLSDMAQYIPKTSFHTVHKEFYMYNPAALNRTLTTMLSEMFSALKSRHLAAEQNPDPFKNVTLNLDGHDSRIIYVNAVEASLYSYKLKKPRFRVQVCIDMNNMVFFVSAPAPCRDYSDGTMLLRLGIQNKIHKVDYVTLDGGYNLFIGKLLDSADELQHENICYPVRKMCGNALTEEEKTYNEIFGSFRSRIESYLGEMQSTFTKFSHMVVNKVSEKETFGVQYKLACLLMSIKRFVALRNIPTEQHHTLWLQDGFDFPSKAEQETMYTLWNIKV